MPTIMSQSLSDDDKKAEKMSKSWLGSWKNLLKPEQKPICSSKRKGVPVKEKFRSAVVTPGCPPPFSMAPYTFAGWQALSGQDSHSKTNWFTQPIGETSRGVIYYNPSRTTLTIDLGSRQYLDLDQQPVVGSLVLPSFSSRILVDNGAAQLMLTGIHPALMSLGEATDFTLTASGAAFTPGSVVRWDGSDRPTIFVSSARLEAVISAADVSAIGEHRVTVWDPNPVPDGSETPALLFWVAPQVFEVYLPQVER